MKRVVGCLVLSWACCLSAPFALAVEKAPAEVVNALGTVRGKPVSTGFVFIDGKYVNPPYRVTRAGNQILVNERPVTGQLVSWEEFVKTQPPSKVTVTEVEESGDEPEAKTPPEKDGDDPAAPKDGGNAPPPKDDETALVRVIVEPRLAADADALDDFNPDSSDRMKLSDIPPDSDEDKARQKRADEEKDEEDEKESEPKKDEGQAGEVSAVDANGDEVDPASPEGEAVAKKTAKAAPPKKMRKIVTLEGKFEMNFKAQKLLKSIDAYRMKLEATLRRGGYLFFGTGAKPYCKGRTSDAASAKELLKKLPELMSKAEESEAFCDAVRTAGLMSFLNLQISQDLFRHKADAVFLKQRRRELAEEEKLQKMMNSHGR